jgi:hypothetical protein
MRRLVACVVIVAFLANCGITIREKEPQEPIKEVQRYPVETDEDVEEVILIDAEKREAVHLFSEIEGFREARLTGSSDGGYEVEIVTTAGKLVSVNKDPNGMVIMRDYLADYENIRGNPAPFEAKWHILDYDTLGAPITRSEVDLSTDVASATGCGCGFGCVAAAVAGLVVGAVALEEAQEAGESGADMGVGIGIMMGGLLLAGLVALVAGASTGCLAGRSAYERSKKNAVEIIKEQRIPRVVE